MASLAESDLDDVESPEEGELETAETTSEEEGDQTPADEEAAAPDPQEGDAEALEEGPAEQEAAGAAEAKPEASADKPAGDDRKTPDEEVAWEPWKPRADGSEFEIEGALVSDRGIWIPAEARPRLQSLLADRRVWERERNQLQGRLREAESARSDAENAAEAVVQFWTKEFFALSREEQVAFLESAAQQQGVVQARADAAREKARADRLEQAESARREVEQSEAAVQWAKDELTRAAEAVAKSDLFRDAELDAAEIRTLLVDYHRRHRNLFIEADERLLQELPGLGLKVGDATIDWRIVADLAGREARVKRAEREAAKAVEKSKKANESKRRGQRESKAAPNVRVGDTPPAAGEQVPELKSKQDWLDSLAGPD